MAAPFPMKLQLYALPIKNAPPPLLTLLFIKLQSIAVQLYNAPPSSAWLDVNVQFITVELNTAPPFFIARFSVNVQLIALTLYNAPPFPLYLAPLFMNVQLIAVETPEYSEYIALPPFPSKVQFIAVAFPKIAPERSPELDA